MRIFNIGLSEIVLVLLIAFLIVGPKDLPRVARWLGRQVKKLRGMIREIKQESGWDELEKEYKSVQTDVKKTAAQMDVRHEIKETAQLVETNLKDAADAAQNKED